MTEAEQDYYNERMAIMLADGVSRAVAHEYCMMVIERGRA